MSKPIIIFIVLLLIPASHRFYSLLSVAPIMSTAPINHLAIIMDGNRRWAKKHNLITRKGHQEGTETVRRLIQYCLERKIKMVSVYAFSLENFQRDPEEVRNIFKIFGKAAEKALPHLLKAGIKVLFIGDKRAFPSDVRATIERVETSTKDGSHLQLNILFCYGGRQEILSAVKHIIEDVKIGKLTQKEIVNDALFRDYLWTHEIPDPDLIIRTGGIKRLSNFLTYQTTYSELYFTDRLWPDLTAKDLDAALEDYTKRKRNFGK